MMRATDLLELTQAAIKFAEASTDATNCREQLSDAYYAWRLSAGVANVLIERNDSNWNAMMKATAGEYRLLQNSKGRERRAKAKLLALARELGGLK